MPSKKNNSKTPSSKFANTPDHHDGDFPSSSPYSVSRSVSSSPSLNVSNLEEELLCSMLDEASAKFPSLISRTAFVGRVSDDAVSDSRGCRIWLSESAMLSSSMSPGSLVSVSLCSLDKVQGGFPLSELSDECARQFGFQLADNRFSGAGNFITLATVYPSCKILKNGVRLSLNLSYTLGCPASGRMVFVYPVKDQPLTVNGNTKLFNRESNCFSSNNCKELYLSLVSLKDKFGTEAAVSSRLDLVTNGQVGNSETSSPKTPSLSESRIGSPFPVQFQMLNCKKSASNTTNFSQQSFDIHDVQQVFGDDSSRKLLEVCTSLWLCSRILISGNLVVVPVLSRLCIFQIVGSERMSPNDDYLGENTIYAFSIDRGTKIHLLLPGDPVVETFVKESLALPITGLGYKKDGIKPNLQKLGGVSKEFTILKDIIVSSAVKGTVASFGLRPTKGVLLHGPPGTGKTCLVRVTVHDVGVNLFTVNGPEIISQYHGESEQALNEVFAKASQAVPAVVFIDEIDAIAPARKDGGDELSQRMVATLLNLMDGISRSDGILIIAATNRPDSIEPALRRPGRLDREIEIGVPSPVQRHEILLMLLSDMQHSLLDKDVQQLAMVTHGFVGADLAALCKEAALVRLRQCVNASSCRDDSDFKLSTVAFDSVCRTSIQSCDVYMNYDTNAPKSLGDSVSNLEDAFSSTSETNNLSDFRDALRITYEDFEKARVRVRPSAMREVNLEVPKVNWDDVGGQKEVKLQLIEAVEWPLKHKDAFKRIGTRPPTGILLFGPPGCSKTLLARAVASEAGLNFLAVKGPELFSKWVGESEKAVRSLFAKARANSPSIVFFDEIDGLAVIRGKESDGVSVGDRVMSQLLVEMDGLQQRGSVTVIAATNRPDKIDPAILRPGRFDRLLYVGPPNKKDREDIFRVHLQRMPCSSDVSISELSLLTEGCTGADISLICREAGIAAMEEDISASEITMEHLKYGIQQVQPSDVQIYEKLSTKFQRLVHSTA